MDSQPNDKYVSQILQQIEELKRKKAQKEMKLKKLKSSRSKTSHQSVKSSEVSSNVILKKTPDIEDLKNNVLHERNFFENIQHKIWINCDRCNEEKNDKCLCYENCQQKNVKLSKVDSETEHLVTKYDFCVNKNGSETANTMIGITGKTENFKSLEPASILRDSKSLDQNISNSKLKDEKLGNVDIQLDPKSCLDKNMTYFVESNDFMPYNEKCIDNYKGDINFKGKKEVSFSSQQTYDRRNISPDIKVISLSCSSQSNESQKNNFSYIDFPKFSSPTDLHSHNFSNEVKSVQPTLLNHTNINLLHSKDPTSESPVAFRSIQKVTNNISKITNLPDNVIENEMDSNFSSSLNKLSRYLSEEQILNCSIIQENNCVSDSDLLNNKASNALDLPINDSICMNLNSPSKFDTVDLVSEIETRRDNAENNYNIDINLQPELFESLDFSLSENMTQIESDVSDAVNMILNKICEHAKNISYIEQVELSHSADLTCDLDVKIIPETENVGDYMCKDMEYFEISLSESVDDLEANDILNMSSQSKIASPIVNKIVSAVKTAKEPCSSRFDEISEPSTSSIFYLEKNISTQNVQNMSFDEGTQDLNNCRSVILMNENDSGINMKNQESNAFNDSSLNFWCCLKNATNEPVCNIEIILFNNSKYMFIQHITQINVWRQVGTKNWIKIFYHTVEEKFALKEICISKDENFLVLIMLLNDYQKHCFQFLLFEKEVSLIKLMENTHWLEKNYSTEHFILCGLEGLMFASVQTEAVQLYAFINLRDNPKLTSVILEVPSEKLKCLCKIDKLPNALMGISDTSLYVWHILEARLVAAVVLHPQEYLPLKNCFWATVENGLIYFMTICDNNESFQVCQLLAANLATGFCQIVMTYSIQPSHNQALKIFKAAYLEPFLVVAHPNGALLWSVMEEFCCASLYTSTASTSVALCKDEENWGFVGVGSLHGCVNCYILK